MKILKYLLYVVLALVAILLILGLVGPKQFDVNRSIVIDAPPSQVWPYVCSLQKMNEWGPWLDADTNAVVEYTGNDCTVGASSSWSGNKDVGKGQQTISVLEPNQAVETNLTFYTPIGDFHPTGYFQLTDSLASTKVTWGIRGTNGFLMRAMSVFSNPDKEIGPQFEKGLNNLKGMVEAAPASGYDIQMGDYAGGKYLGARQTLKMDQMQSFFETNLGKAMETLTQQGVTVAGPPSGLYYTWDEEKGETDMAAAVPFAGEMKSVPQGMTVLEIPAARSVTLNYYGGYNGLGAAHMALDTYLKENNLMYLEPAIEEYHTDPMTQPDSTKWLTKIIYLVK